MVKQGDVIRISFDPQKGHEQAGTRPALVVSNDFFNAITPLAVVCPITRTDNGFPLHIPLPKGMTTIGFVLCEHVRTLDLSSRSFAVIEQAPAEFVQNVSEILCATFRKEPSPSPTPGADHPL